MKKPDFKKIWGKIADFFKKRLVQNAILTLGLVAATFFGYYFLFSSSFDTPIDRELKTSIEQMRTQYDRLSRYNDEIDVVLENLKKRDSIVYFTIFNTYPEPPAVNDLFAPNTDLYYESDLALVALAKKKRDNLAQHVDTVESDFLKVEAALLAKSSLSSIPSMQPVANRDLTVRITPAGRRIDPFYKGPMTHWGIDYLVPEETRVFATANGTVESVSALNSKQGYAVTINHPGGYSTVYAHLQKAIVSGGQQVVQGEIIGYSGNTGVSFIPHLHYEVKYNKRNLDPTDFFFKELDPNEVRYLKKLAEQNILALD